MFWPLTALDDGLGALVEGFRLLEASPNLSDDRQATEWLGAVPERPDQGLALGMRCAADIERL